MLLKTEVDALRTQAIRTVGGIERDLELGESDNLRDLEVGSWLAGHWQRLVPSNQKILYAAIISEDGEILAHNDQAKIGERLARDWYEQVLFEVAHDVVRTRNPALSSGKPAYDVSVPIEFNTHEIGEYHIGLSVDQFEQQTAELQATFLWRRFPLIGGVLMIFLVATTSLYHIARRATKLDHAVRAATIERATEVGKLAAGLAHEIRNPLHAIQLNLHAFRKVHEGAAELEAEEISRMLAQSSREISRIEQLMQELVGFATPAEPADESIDLNEELRNVAEFLEQEMLDRDIELRLCLPCQRLEARMDRGRLRQIVLNLLQNAQQAMTDPGRIELTLSTAKGGWAEIAVRDSGPGIPEAHRQQVFEPFYSTKSKGTGLGLALVKRFVEEVNGQVSCEENSDGGSTFRIRIHRVNPS
jgi:signal transduction histidine kinase